MKKEEILLKYYGYKGFRNPQDLIIDSVLDGNDTIALLPTGFGKSVTFQVPALMLEGLTIVVSPLISLMVDQVNSLNKRNIPAIALNSNISLYEQRAIYKELLRGKYKLLYVSAERLQNEYFISQMKELNVSLFVVDEAHTILWGEGFREAFLYINHFVKSLNNRPIILSLTATATSNTIEKIKYYMELDNPKIVSINSDRENIFYRVIKTKDKNKQLLAYLSFNKNKKGIIYTLTRRKTTEISKFLTQNNINNVIYHGGLSVEEKKEYQESFGKNGNNVIICTNAFGMGIDIPDIRFVICYDIPSSIEDLSQQIGRAARDGAYAEGIVFFDFKDINTLNYFIESSDVNEKVKNDLRKKKEDIIDFCLSKKCRHQLLCSYFGNEIKRCLNKCDNCKK